MDDELVRKLASEVIRRLVSRQGGGRGTLVLVFTGATIGFNKAVEQVRGLAFDGWRLSLVLSEAAENIYGRALSEQMADLPLISRVQPGKWLPLLVEAKAVVVPLMSVNTLSKIAMLTADTTAGNVILHALFMGKKVIAARDGADPAGKGRKTVGLNRGSPALQRALAERLMMVEEFGCLLVESADLRNTVNCALLTDNAPAERESIAKGPERPLVSCPGSVVTAADIRHAQSLGADLQLSRASRVTPLARELAVRYGVGLVEQSV
ncbi:MAG: flavoprotein [Syntrophobacteraceae bacterium]|nr:flavoprotein [Syntrophobacteraceae bacterium]